jgi:regulator of protease activity HflC (stomatin/prohibitin superfamily)
MQTREFQGNSTSGWSTLAVLLVGSLALASMTIAAGVTAMIPLLIPLALIDLVVFICWFGFFTLQPNQAAVLVLFGRHRGTVRETGFRWANPLQQKIKISLRARNLNMDKLKVNDRRGNPVEIAAVVVWHVADTARAVFDVENYEHFVSVQSEAALRHTASAYPYDTTEEGEVSLRGSMDAVSEALQKELQDRVAKAGVLVDDARLSHLAYAPEIAQVMLQRQQAEAVVAARTRIVDGAVGIVEMALSRIEHSQAIKLDEERRATMVNNLLVVLCGDKSAHPVVNAGTLYN